MTKAIISYLDIMVQNALQHISTENNGLLVGSNRTALAEERRELIAEHYPESNWEQLCFDLTDLFATFTGTKGQKQSLSRSWSKQFNNCFPDMSLSTKKYHVKIVPFEAPIALTFEQKLTELCDGVGITDKSIASMIRCAAKDIKETAERAERATILRRDNIIVETAKSIAQKRTELAELERVQVALEN